VKLSRIGLFEYRDVLGITDMEIDDPDRDNIAILAATKEGLSGKVKSSRGGAR
jgi:hypothetical protein